MKPPQNLQDLYDYLGLVNHLKHSSPKLAESTAQLGSFCKRGIVFTWEISKQAAFKAIRKEITNASILAYFDKLTPSIIQSDASKRELAVVSV